MRPGPDFGRLVRGEIVNGVSPAQVMGATREGRKIVLSGDTSPCEALAIAAHQADVLIHEATFIEEEAERARQTGHSTVRQAAEVARKAEARMLVLTHLSTRYAGGEVRREARAAFPDTEVPRDFDTVEVPFPERGSASLIRWSERVAAAANGAGSAGEGSDGARSGARGAREDDQIGAGEAAAEESIVDDLGAAQDAKRASSSIIQ